MTWFLKTIYILLHDFLTFLIKEENLSLDGFYFLWWLYDSFFILETWTITRLFQILIYFTNLIMTWLILLKWFGSFLDSEYFRLLLESVCFLSHFKKRHHIHVGTWICSLSSISRFSPSLTILNLYHFSLYPQIGFQVGSCYRFFLFTVLIRFLILLCHFTFWKYFQIFLVPF